MGIRYGGRAKGTPNKATVEKQLLAAREQARSRNKETALQVMEKIAKICEGAAAVNRPVTAEELENGAKAKPEANWDRFRDWVTLWAATVRELAKYQHPQIKPVDAPAPPPDPNAAEPSRRFTLRVFEGGRALPPPDNAR